MKFLLVSSFVASALAVKFPRVLVPRETALEVTVESVGNSALKAVITNTGTETLKLMKAGSILDDRAVERAEVYSGTDQITFEGIRLAVQQTGLTDAAFVTLEAGGTVENEWDPAEVHDLSAGGDLDFVIRGSFLTATANSTEITGEIPFTSTMKSTVNGTGAAKVRRSFVEAMEHKRSAVQDDCTGTRGDAQLAALDECARLATNAETAALNGSSSKMIEFFASDSTSTRQNVADVFAKIADECRSTTTGISDQYCTDALNNCDDDMGILAYTVPSRNVMVSCGLYFNELPALEDRCHRQDQATTTLHEVTHLRAVAGTLDLAYGYDLLVELSASEALENADTYAVFSNAIEAGC